MAVYQIFRLKSSSELCEHAIYFLLDSVVLLSWRLAKPIFKTMDNGINWLTISKTSVVTDLVATVIPTERSDEESLLGEPEIPLPSGHRNDNS